MTASELDKLQKLLNELGAVVFDMEEGETRIRLTTIIEDFEALLARYVREEC